MSVFEQSKAVSIPNIMFDSEFVLKFISVDGREVFKAYNVPEILISDLINESKKIIPTPFTVEYKTPSLNHSLYIGMSGFQIEPFRFNTKYNKRSVVSKNSMVYRLGCSVGEIISSHSKRYSKDSSRFIQACILREFIPNHWVGDETSTLNMFSEIDDTDVAKLANLELMNCEPKSLTIKDRMEISSIIAKRFPNYINHNADLSKGRFLLTETQNSYMLEHEFQFKGKTFLNWYDAFLDHIKRAEHFYDGKPRPTLKNHIGDQLKLNRVVAKISELEKANIQLRSADTTGLDSKKVKEIHDLIAENAELLSELRFKRKEYNIRSDRQLVLMNEKYLSCTNKKSYLVKKHLEADIAFLDELRHELIVKKLTNHNAHKEMDGVIKVAFKGVRIDGVAVVQGKIDFAFNPTFINRMYSRNIEAFEGVVKMVFEMPDGKQIWHIPSYVDEDKNRVDTKGLLIHFDQNIFDWMISQEQTRQNMIIQAVLNQHGRVTGE